MRPQQSLWSALSAVPFTLDRVDAGGVATRMLVAGPDDAPPLLLLHGTGGHLETYAYNVAAHAEQFRTYALDFVGHGYSDRPDIDYEVEAYVDHILAFLDARGIARAHMSGQSLGGWAAARLAARHPERVDRLLLNTAGGFSFGTDAMAEAKRRSRADAIRTRDGVRKRLELLVHDPDDITEELVEVRLRIYTQEGYADTMARILCLQDPDVRRRNLMQPEEYERIQAETLVVWTPGDPVASVDVGREIARLIPCSRFEVMDGCGHWPQYEDPERFNALSVPFFARGLDA